MGRATSVKEKTSFSGAVNGCAPCPGSIICAYLRAGGIVRTAVCGAVGAKGCAGGCACGCGASGKAAASIVPGLLIGVCAKAGREQVRVKMVRTRPQQSRGEFVKRPLPASNLLLSPVYSSEGGWG